MSTEHLTSDPGGFVPRLGADPSSARYELLTAAQATERVAAAGFDPTDAARMVDQYLAQNIAAFGPGPGDGWRVDPYDLAEITRAYDWVDHYSGETIADARARAAGYATDYQQRAAAVDREQDPGYAARVDREAVEWAERAREGHNPWPAPDPRMPTADGAIGDRTEVEEQSAVEAVGDALEDAEPRTAEQDTRSALVVSASWALAARDAAIEQGATEHATRFAEQAREALAAVEAAGITREQLAVELDYPGGAAELDGEHVDLAVTYGAPLSAATLAAWAAVDDDPAVAAEHAAAWTRTAARMTETGQHTAARLAGEEADRWATRARGVSESAEVATPTSGSTTDGDTDGDTDGGVRGPDTGPQPVPLDGPGAAPRDADTDTHDAPGAATRGHDQAGGLWDEPGAGRDDPDAVAWWEPIGTGEVTLSHPEVVAELTHAGMTADQARDALTRYLDDTSRQVGVSVHRWGLDLHDVQAIAHTHRAGQVAAMPEQRGPGRGEWDQVRGEDPRSYDQMMGDAAAALTARPAVPADVEDQRRQQLIRWHTDDHTSAHEDGHGDDGAVRTSDDYAPSGASEQW